MPSSRAAGTRSIRVLVVKPLPPSLAHCGYGSHEWSAPGTLGSMYRAPKRTNISFSVLSPPVIAHASHQPSPAPGVESQSVSWVHGSATLPSTHATGVHLPIYCCALSGTRDARVTRLTFGSPSIPSPLL